MRPPASLRARTPAAAGNDRFVSSVGWGVAFVLGQLGSQPWDSAAMDAVPPCVDTAAVPYAPESQGSLGSYYCPYTYLPRACRT